MMDQVKTSESFMTLVDVLQDSTVLYLLSFRTRKPMLLLLALVFGGLTLMLSKFSTFFDANIRLSSCKELMTAISRNQFQSEGQRGRRFQGLYGCEEEAGFWRWVGLVFEGKGSFGCILSHLPPRLLLAEGSGWFWGRCFWKREKGLFNPQINGKSRSRIPPFVAEKSR